MKQFSVTNLVTMMRAACSRCTIPGVQRGALHGLRALTLVVSVSALHAWAASTPVDVGGSPAPAPAWQLGDRWTYEAEDGYRMKTRWLETREVTTLDRMSSTIRITTSEGGIAATRNEVWASPGEVRVGALGDGLTRHFDVPLQRYRYPLTPGQTWNQWLHSEAASAGARGTVNHYVRVGSWEKVSTPAGTFDALRLYVITRLDDGEFWRRPTTETDSIWYAPAVRGVVKEERDAEYLLVGDSGTVRTRHARLRLTHFDAGASVTGLDAEPPHPRVPLAFPNYADLG